MKILNTEPFWAGRIAQKTKGLKAKSIVDLDETLVRHLLLTTREGDQPVDKSNWICIGVGNEAWQQPPANLLKGYNIVDIDANGWTHWNPKPSKTVEYFEVTEEVIESSGRAPAEPTYIIGQWGSTIVDYQNCQRVQLGDFVARQLDNHDDIWIVARDLWLKTYTDVTGT